jgi:hypothetical protein
MAQDTTVLMTSKNPDEVMSAATSLAGSAEVKDQSVLLGFLNVNANLAQLDTEQELSQSSPTSLRVARVMQVLMENSSPAAKGTLVGLARGGDFISRLAREELLVRALVAVRPAPPEAIKFWDAESQKKSLNLQITIPVLCDNGSEPAIRLLEKKLSDPQQEPIYRKAWMRRGVLSHRTDVPMLEGCLRMVTGDMSPEMKVALVEALCDYKREWYLACLPPKAPVRALASKEAKELTRKICEYAIDKLTLAPEQRLAVEKTLVEVGGKAKESSTGQPSN